MLLLPAFSFAQNKLAMEQYYFVQPKEVNTIIPKINYESPKHWFVEGRYNWEEVQTASFHVGRSFEFKNIKGLDIKPVAGICFGQLNGGSLGTIIEYATDKFFISSEPQYVFAFNDKARRYLYSWSEASYSLTKMLYTGVALQHTKVIAEKGSVEPGLMAGISINNFEIPVYCFQPFNSARNFVVGVNWHWQK